MENTSVVQQWIYANHIENTASSVVFTARLTETEVIRWLPAYSLSSIALGFTCNRLFTQNVFEGTCLASRCPATGLYVTIFLSNDHRITNFITCKIIRTGTNF
jgi:hypothetical protein